MTGSHLYTPAGAGRASSLRDQALWALIAAITYFCMTAATIALTSDGRNPATVWPSDAVILALLLSRPRRDWPVLLLSGWLANLLANGVARGWTPGIVLFGAVNMGQTLLAAQMLLSRWGRRESLPGEDLLSDGRTIARFLLAAGLISPVLGAVAGAVVSVVTFGDAPVPDLIRWYASNTLGFVIFTPFFKGLFDGSYARALENLARPELLRGIALFALHISVTLLVFGQNQLPILFLPFPTLLLLSFGLGRLATQAGVILVALIGALAAIHHDGPMTLIRQVGPFALTPQIAAFEILCFQIYLAVLMCTALPVASIVASRAEARKLLSAREELLRLVMAHSPDAIIGLDGNGVCRWADGPIEDYTGQSPDALIGLPLAEIALRAGLDLDQLRHDSVRGEGGARTVELRPAARAHLTLEASLRLAPPVPGQAVGSVITLRDITVRKARELAISRRIETDDLTGVFNRAGFRRRLARAIEALADNPGRALTLALIDVDHFKAINDTHGHPAGDAALVEIARRLLSGTREDDVVGRLSGDEFAILLRCSVDTARTICERIVRAISAEPIVVIESVVVLSSISCGLAELRPGMSREALFDSADFALYEAKRSGRNSVRAVA
jgi:diguanylate cyclase (GGDEF)-like protein/PAS domain S-box-containing protein